MAARLLGKEDLEKALRWTSNDPPGEQASVAIRAHIAALEKERQRYSNVMARLAEEVEHFTGKPCASDFMAVIGGIERAAVRARNEGLEKAATATDDESSQWAEAEETDDTGSVRRIRDALRDSSKRIRAMKEPEE